jgi:hypothetical protein
MIALGVMVLSWGVFNGANGVPLTAANAVWVVGTFLAGAVVLWLTDEPY